MADVRPCAGHGADAVAHACSWRRSSRTQLNPISGAGAATVAALGAVALAGVAWTGLHVPSRPLPKFAQGGSGQRGTLPVPADVPEPVARYYRATFGDRVPEIESAVITAHGYVRLGGIPLPARFRFTHLARHGYRHYIEAIWFGLPVLRVNEWFLDGRARLDLPVGRVSNDPSTDSAANLALWLETVCWLPAVLATDPRVSWTDANDQQAVLVVPASSGADRITMTFDGQSGLVARMDTLRFKSPRDNTRIPYRGVNLAWRRLEGMQVASEVVVQWMDAKKPAFKFIVDDIVYNAGVAAYIRAAGA